jgi:hypothetical protein
MYTTGDYPVIAASFFTRKTFFRQYQNFRFTMWALMTVTYSIWKQYALVVHIVTWRPKAGIVKSEEKSIARQLLGKHITTVTNTQATIE